MVFLASGQMAAKGLGFLSMHKVIYTKKAAQTYINTVAYLFSARKKAARYGAA